MRRLGSRRPRTINALLVGVSLLLGVGLGEISLRLAGFRPLQESPERSAFWRYDPVLGWHHTPGHRGRFRMRDFDVAVSINDQGLRDRDYPYERVPGKRRILVLGDSFAWGFGVEQPACFTELVERSLADVEVINAAVSGYSTDQELLWLVNEGLKYRPDVVLLLVSGNDVAMNMTSLAYGVYYKPQFRCNAGGDLRWPLPPVPKAGMLRRSLFASRFHSSVAQLAFQSLDRLSERWFPIDGGAAVALTLRLLEEISRRSEAIDARFLVVLHAGFWDSSVGRYDDFAAAVSRRFPETLDLGTLSEESRRVMTLRGNGHWNSIGHEWVARRVLDYLAEQGLQRVP